MSDYIGTREQVDEYVGSRLVEAAYLGSRKYYDAYSEVTGSLPLVYESRVEHILKNYALYGSASGAGTATENLYNKDAKDTNNGYVNNRFLYNDGTTGNATSYYISEYFSVQPNEEYTFIGGDGVNAPSLCYYDANYDYLSGVNYNSRNKVTTTAPNDAAYARISVPPGREGMTMFVSGSTAPTSYIPYGYQIPLANTGKNLFDKDATDINNGYIDSTFLIYSGEPLSSSSWLVSEFIRVNSGNYAIKNQGVASTASICFYDANKTYVSGQNYQSSTNLEVTIPQNVVYVRMSVKKDSGATASFTKTATYPLYIGSTQLGEEEYLDYESGKVYKRTENLFNYKNKSDITNNKYISSTDGTLVNNVNYYTTDYIQVSPSTQYVWDYGMYLGPTSTAGFYDSSKNLISWFPRDATTQRLYLETPANCAYVRASVYRGNERQAMLTEGSTAQAQYIPYLQPTDPPVPFPPISTYQGENTLSSTETVGTVTVKGRINESST